MTRWRKVFAIAGLTEANVTPDTAPMIAAGAVPKFLTSWYRRMAIRSPTPPTTTSSGRAD